MKFIWFLHFSVVKFAVYQNNKNVSGDLQYVYDDVGNTRSGRHCITFKIRLHKAAATAAAFFLLPTKTKILKGNGKDQEEKMIVE